MDRKYPALGRGWVYAFAAGAAFWLIVGYACVSRLGGAA